MEGKAHLGARAQSVLKGGGAADARARPTLRAPIWICARHSMPGAISSNHNIYLTPPHGDPHTQCPSNEWRRAHLMRTRCSVSSASIRPSYPPVSCVKSASTPSKLRSAPVAAAIAAARAPPLMPHNLAINSRLHPAPSSSSRTRQHPRPANCLQGLQGPLGSAPPHLANPRIMFVGGCIQAQPSSVPVIALLCHLLRNTFNCAFT